MPLVNLLSGLDSESEFLRYSFSHSADHDEIDAALLSRGVTPFAVPLNPVGLADGGVQWQLLHQQKHEQMNAALGLSSSTLIGFDFRKKDDRDTFVGVNFGEHVSAREVLGI